MVFREHISRALPTVTIFYLLRSIRSKILIPDCSKEMLLDTLDIIIKWLQGSVIVNATDKKNPSRLKKSDLCLGTWFRATERFVRSLQGRNSSTRGFPLTKLFTLK